MKSYGITKALTVYGEGDMNVCAKLYQYPSGSCSHVSLKATTLWDERGNVSESPKSARFVLSMQ